MCKKKYCTGPENCPVVAKYRRERMITSWLLVLAIAIMLSYAI